MCFVALLTIAAAAAGPVRAQSNHTKYTSAVAMSALQVGDTLAEGFSLTSNESNTIYFVANRHKNNENLFGSQESINSDWIQSIGANCVFSTHPYNEDYTTTFAPVDENGRDGDAWVVTEVESIAGFTNITIAGIRIPGPPITVRFAAGTEEAANWTLASGNASVPGTQVLENVMAGSELTATYSGTQKVKSVEAVKYVVPAATVTTAPTATEAYIEVGSTSALVNAGAANGGTMMYAVTTTNAQPASTAGFSATIPTAEGRTAGTYYVWYYAKADADHSDSEIAGPVSDTLADMTTVTWNSTNVFNSAHQGDELDYWSPNPRTYEGITISKSGPDYSSFYAYSPGNQVGTLTCWGDKGDSFTFTAPSGKKFCKIEIIDNESIGFDDYGDWTKDVIYDKIVWSGTAANAVTLGTVFTGASNLNSIVFKLIDAPLSTLTISGQTIYYVPGESWADAITNHQTENAGWTIYYDMVLHGNDFVADGIHNTVSPGAEINPNETYNLESDN